MCLPEPSFDRPSQPLPKFLDCLDMPPRNGNLNVRISGDLPCGCRLSRSARRSGIRCITVNAKDGTVSHTRCGRVLARLVDGKFVSEPMPEPTRTTTPPTPTRVATGPTTMPPGFCCG